MPKTILKTVPKNIKAIIVSVFFTHLALPQVTMAESSGSEVYSLGLLDVAPFGWKDEQGNIHGVTYQNLLDITHYAAPKANTTVILGNSNRLVHGLIGGHIDVLISVWFQSLEDEAIRFGPIIYVPIEVWRRAEDNSADPFSGRLAVSKYYEDIPELKNKTFTILSNENRSSVRLLKAKRTDGIISDAVSLCQSAKDLEIPISEFRRYRINSIPIYLWLRKTPKITDSLARWDEAARWFLDTMKDQTTEELCISRQPGGILKQLNVRS